MTVEVLVVVTEPASAAVGVHRPSLFVLSEDGFFLRVRARDAERGIGITRVFLDRDLPIVDAFGEADVPQDHAVLAARAVHGVVVVCEGYSGGRRRWIECKPSDCRKCR